MSKLKVLMHLDMNSYFASVEQQANIHLRGKPVGVCAYLSPRGCIIACSIEAKEKGVRTGMRVQDAKKLCPDIELVENDPAKYRTISKQIFGILAQYSDALEVYSIDEAFVDLTGYVDSFLEAKNLAIEIKQRIKAEIGSWLRCSVGLAETKWLAKFASEENKPDGLTIFLNKDLDDILRNRPLQHAWGIGERLAIRFKLVGINTLYDLKHYPVTNLRKIFGINGYYLWAHLNGIEVSGFKSYQKQPKSIGHSYCLKKQTTDLGYLRSIMMKLCAKTGVGLRSKGLQAQVIYTGYSFLESGGVWHSWKLSKPIFDSRDIWLQANNLINNKLVTEKVRMMAISVTGLSPQVDQLSLFGKEELIKKQVVQAIDNINNTYGSYVVVPGAMFDLQDLAVDRIGFRKSINPKSPQEKVYYTEDEY